MELGTKAETRWALRASYTGRRFCWLFGVESINRECKVSDPAVPHLLTAQTGPLLQLEQRILDSLPAIERWFRLQWQDHTPPFYGSVDLRNAGFKLAPVDMNLFQADLTICLTPCCRRRCRPQTAIDRICPDARNLLLIPERHTRNQFY